VGLANKVASKFADKVFVSFEDSLKFFPKSKVELSGYPVRDVFLTNELEYKTYLGINLKEQEKPILFVTGGGNGSKLLNDKIKSSLDFLTREFNIIHQVGAAYIDEYRALQTSEYKVTDFVGDEMPDLFKAADIIISRSGAGTVAELMALKKPSIFIPLKIAQKNEQYHNAMVAKASLSSKVIEENEFMEMKLEDIIRSFKVSKKTTSNVQSINSASNFLVSKIKANYSM